MWGRWGGSWWPLGIAGTQPTALGGTHSGGNPTAALGPLSRYRLAAGTSEKIQLSSLIAAFQVTRDLVVAEA